MDTQARREESGRSTKSTKTSSLIQLVEYKKTRNMSSLFTEKPRQSGSEQRTGPGLNTEENR